MTDPNKPIIDTRTTVLDGSPSYTSSSPNISTSDGGGPTLPQQSAPIEPAGYSSSSSTVKTSTTAPIYTTIPNEFKGSSNQELIDYLEKKIKEYKPLSEEDEKKLRRRQKTEGIISGISDAVQSVANLIFTHQYAPNMYNAKEGMSAKAKERFEKEKAQREADADKYFQYALTIGKMKDDMAKDERNWAHTLEREKIQDQRNEAADTRAQAKADRDAAMAKLRMELMQGKIDQQEAAAEAERIEANYAEAYWQSRINKNNYRRPIGARGGGKTPEYPWYDQNGNLHYASSYEAMRQNALNHGTWSDATQQSTTERKQLDRLGKTKSTTSSTTTKPAKGHSKKPQKPQQGKKKTNVIWN